MGALEYLGCRPDRATGGLLRAYIKLVAAQLAHCLRRQTLEHDGGNPEDTGCLADALQRVGGHGGVER